MDVTDPRWGHFVATQPAATCFHTPEWALTIAECYEFRAFVVAETDRTGAVLAGLPIVEVRALSGRRRWVSLPFSDECGPLAVPGTSTEAVVRHADVLRRRAGAGVLQVRTALEYDFGSTERVALIHALPLAGSAERGTSGRRLRAPVRRHIATANREGVTVRFADRADDLVAAYYGLHVQTRRRQGVPVQPRRYFRLLWERMILPGRGFVLLASAGPQVLAGAVYLLGGGTVTYKYGASDPRFWPMRANHAVMATAIAWATEHGYSSFDFGRTDLDNPGLARFKESWGASPRPLQYTHVPSRQHAYQSLHGASRAISPVIRRAPELVCRGLGEVLYRYAG